MTYRHRIAAIRHMGAYLADRDVPPSRLLRDTGLPASLFLDSAVWIDRSVSLRLALQLRRLTGDALCGAHVCEDLGLDQYGFWGDGISGSRTVRDALRFAAAELHRIETGTRIQLRLNGDEACLSAVFDGELTHDPTPHHHGNLKALRNILDLAAEPIITDPCFPHGRLVQTDELERLYGPNLRFNHPEPALLFHREVLDLPLRQHSATKSVHGTSPSTPCEMAGAVFRVLCDTIALERPSLSRVARTLSVGLRTLQRRLASYGVTFEEILDEYRHRCALDFLEDPDRSITDTAFRLGYSDSAHFTRAFRRWTGMSPSQFTRSLDEAGATLVEFKEGERAVAIARPPPVSSALHRQTKGHQWRPKP